MLVPLSHIPVGHKFTYQDKEYVKSNHNRGLQYINGRPIFLRLYKHQEVNWLTPFPGLYDNA